jgi:hypothetical protein
MFFQIEQPQRGNPLQPLVLEGSIFLGLHCEGCTETQHPLGHQGFGFSENFDWHCFYLFHKHDSHMRKDAVSASNLCTHGVRV